jgi:hypothetical protein
VLQKIWHLCSFSTETSDEEYQDPVDDESEEENPLSASGIHQQEEDQGPSLD